ncbi:hypothetical protein [Vibrio sp. 10N.261.55.A7]|uniref:hypothetical protein n=1 Tax=Vibrio sp. 10N.261.55.A7 TaxID=1880851 RepID=UPI000C827D1D|nr:hypothetical protein [Vibrio sp. 10N.261.55.A7]PMK02452.1 hypothetical protein BCU12_18490 [Vibrio sp. 10N.261.55.A7]
MFSRISIDKSMFVGLIVVGFALFATCAVASDEVISLHQNEDLAREEKIENAFIQVNVSLDLHGIEQSLDATGESLNALAESLNAIAESPELSSTQQGNIEATMDNVNQLIKVSTLSLEKLPVALSESKKVVGEKTQLFLDDVAFKLIVITSLAVLALLFIIGCIYWLLLRPLQSTVLNATTNVAEMAQALQVTAKAVEVTTEKQQAMSEQLSKLT